MYSLTSPIFCERDVYSVKDMYTLQKGVCIGFFRVQIWLFIVNRALFSAYRAFFWVFMEQFLYLIYIFGQYWTTFNKIRTHVRTEHIYRAFLSVYATIFIFNLYILTILNYIQENTHTCAHRTYIYRAFLSVYGAIHIFSDHSCILTSPILCI